MERELRAGIVCEHLPLSKNAKASVYQSERLSHPAELSHLFLSVSFLGSGMTKSQFPSDHQYMIFGRIVSMHARFEAGLHHMLALMLGVPLPFGLILSAPYTTSHLRNAIRSIAKLALSDYPEHLTKLIAMTGRHKALDRVRHDIGHNMWRRGPTDDIMVAVQTDIADGKAKFKGLIESAVYESRAYSTEDLWLAAN